MQRTLHFLADRIELVLAAHKVPARVTGGAVSPRLVRFQLTTPLGIRLRQVQNLCEELALSLGTPSCRVFRHGGQLQVEVPRTDAQPIHLLELCDRLVAGGRSLVPPFTAVLGLDPDGVPILLRLPSPDVAHVLIAGTTGSGKTALARSIVASLAAYNLPRNLQVAIIDPKARGFVAFDHLPHLLLPVVTRSDEALPLLLRLVEEMERRDSQRRSHPRIVLVLDELADLVLTGGKPMEAALTRLTQRGREAGIHLIACAQKPTALVIGSLVKSNFPVRLVGAVSCPEDAKVASGLANTGAERLLGQGDFLCVAKGQITRLQAAYIDADRTRELVARLRRGGGQPLLVEPDGLRALAATGTDGCSAGEPQAGRRPRPALGLLRSRWPVRAASGVKR